MDFLCPSCQKMLTVPDQYAGTLMKCPLCQNTFQAPALPAQQTPLAPAALPADVPPPSAAPDVYGLKDSITAAAPAPAAPASAVPPPTSVATGTGSAPPALGRAPAPPAPPLPPSTEHRAGFVIPLRPSVLQWVALVSLVLVFLLTFFPWVGSYFNGVSMLTQGAWGALVGLAASPDATLWQTLSQTTPDKVVGWNLILLPYLPLLLVTLVLAVATVVLPRTQVRLPPAVDQFKQYGWAAVAGLAALGFVLLFFLWVLGFSMQHNAYNAAAAQAASEESKSDQEKGGRIAMEYQRLGVQQTVWFRLALLLQLVAAVAAGLTFWVEYRGSREPVPHLALRW